jgi:hypothetical protein
MRSLKMRSLKIIFFITCLSLYCYSLKVRAEYCDMVGCYGRAWIHIPKSQYEENNKKELMVNNINYKFDRSDRLFVEDELPEVGEIVTLNMDILSFDHLPISSLLEG